MAAPMNARRIRQQLGALPFPCEIAPGVEFTVKVVDVMTAYVNNILPMPLIEAANDLNGWRAELRQLPEDQRADALQQVPAERKQRWTDALRMIARLATVEPVLVPTEQDITDPDTQVPVTDLEFTQLLAIYDAAPPPEPAMPEAQAGAFRPSAARQPGPAAPAVGAQPSVPAPAVALAPPAGDDGGEFLHG